MRILFFCLGLLAALNLQAQKTFEHKGMVIKNNGYWSAHKTEGDLMSLKLNGEELYYSVLYIGKNASNEDAALKTVAFMLASGARDTDKFLKGDEQTNLEIGKKQKAVATRFFWKEKQDGKEVWYHLYLCKHQKKNDSHLYIMLFKDAGANPGRYWLHRESYEKETKFKVK